MPDPSPKSAWELLAPPPEPAAKPAGATGDYFDEDAAERACFFFESFLRHSKGKFARKPFLLEPWQRQILRDAFGWKRADGTRQYRTVYVEIPKKNGKSTFAAGVALYLLTGDHEAGAEVYSAAADDQQARIVFDEAKNMVNASADLADLCTVHTSSIFVAQTLSRYQALTGKPNTKHGFNVHGAIFDELHAWKDRDLYDFLVFGTAARDQPLTFVITTAGVYGESIGWETHDYAVKVRDGVIEDPEFLPVIYAADEKDDWHSEEVWKRANPNYGVSVNPDYFAKVHREACESPAKENNFKRLHLNLWTQQVQRWLQMESWDKCAAAVDESALEGRECYGGLDLSNTTDLAALVWAFPDGADPELLDLLCRFWIPGDNMPLRTKKDRVPYEQWQRRGLVTATPGNVIDYGAIRAQINADAARFDVKEVAFDPWNASSLVAQLTGDDGLPMIEHRQTIAAMAWPTKHLEKLVVSGKLRHGGHAVLRWNAANVAITSDHAGNYKPAKNKSTGRIDGIVAAIMAAGRAGASLGAGGSVYDKRGLIDI